MSHLGQRLSGLVDGELGDAERDRVHAHLAGCGKCRAEAVALRTLKRRIHGLEETAADAALTRRLIALAEPGEPVPPRSRPVRGTSSPRPAFRTFSDDHPRSPRQPASAARGTRPVRLTLAAAATHGPAGTRFRHGHIRYVLFGVMSLLVVGIGGAAFMMGGGQPSPGPRITPPVEMYSVEHAVTTGEVPLSGPSPSLAPEEIGPSQKP